MAKLSDVKLLWIILMIIFHIGLIHLGSAFPTEAKTITSRELPPNGTMLPYAYNQTKVDHSPMLRKRKCVYIKDKDDWECDFEMPTMNEIEDRMLRSPSFGRSVAFYSNLADPNMDKYKYALTYLVGWFKAKDKRSTYNWLYTAFEQECESQ